MRIIFIWVLIAGLSACSEEQSADPVTAFGGRLFDNWYAETGADFVPDNPATPEADGRGGPNGDGTLNDASGQPILNSGHDYRFKNLFGWDLLANSGIYGEDYQAKGFVLAAGPANDMEPTEVWVDRVTNGWNDLPAYGEVLTRVQISMLVGFMLAMRDGTIPGPDDLWDLSGQAPGGFVMKSGGNPNRGRFYYGQNCAICHGDDGTAILLNNGAESLGQYTRNHGYAMAMISMNGKPASEMGPQLPAGRSKERQAQTLRNLVAALCDRTEFGIGQAGTPDVPDGDARCGEYLR